jgi:ApeA N-terminal domain 1
MTDESILEKTRKYAVDIYDDMAKHLGKGTLSFGGNRATQFQFDRVFQSKDVPEGTKYRILRAKDAQGTCFTLFDCTYSWIGILADFVIDGDVAEQFQRIEIRYSDISEWFLSNQRLNVELGKSLTWDGVPEELLATVKTNTEHFTLSSEVLRECTSKGEDHLLHEHVLFAYESVGGYFDANDARRKPVELLRLLSILLAYPISILSITVRTSDGEMHAVHCPTYKRIERDSSDNIFWSKCLLPRALINGKWQAVIEKYYASDYRAISWTSLAGMQRYDGFWEYEALGYVTILDKYVSQFSARKLKRTRSLRTKEVQHFSRMLDKLVPQVSDGQRRSIVDLAEKTFSVSRKPDFAAKYKYAVGTSDADVVKIINISEEDFAFIKEVRDRIAHGEAVEFASVDIQKVSSVVDKIALLMTYWAYSDWGFTPSEFIGCLKFHNPLVLNPHLNKKHLARVTGSAKFYTVSEAEFTRISSVKGITSHGCFARSPAGAIVYSERYTSAYRASMAQLIGRGGPIEPSKIFGVSGDQVEFSGEAYIECGDDYLEVYFAYVIDEPEEPAVTSAE